MAAINQYLVLISVVTPFVLGANEAPLAPVFLPENKDPSKVYRPCPDLDIDCIRKFFGAHADCKIQHGQVPDPLIDHEANMFLPTFNLTVTQFDVRISQRDANITEFYVNEETDLVVLQIDFKNVRRDSDLDVYRYHRSGRTPAVTVSNSRTLFPRFQTTTQFYGRDHFKLSHSVTNAFLPTIGQFYINPSAGVSSDPDIAIRFAAYMANPYSTMQDAFFNSAQVYAANFIQCTICDFGLHLA